MPPQPLKMALPPARPVLLVGSPLTPWYSQRSPKGGSAASKDRRLSGWSQSHHSTTSLSRTKRPFVCAVADCSALAHSSSILQFLRTRTWISTMFLTSDARPRPTRQLRCGPVVREPSSRLGSRLPHGPLTISFGFVFVPYGILSSLHYPRPPSMSSSQQPPMCTCLWSAQHCRAPYHCSRTVLYYVYTTHFACTVSSVEPFLFNLEMD
jgi:hypothetical protein